MRDAAMTMAKGDKKEDDEAYSPFAGLQKAAVLQEKQMTQTVTALADSTLWALERDTFRRVLGDA